MSRLIKRIIIILASGAFIFLILYGRSMKPMEIEISYDGLMYIKDAHIAGDYDNLDMKKTTVRIQGKLYRKWFSVHYFEGFIDTDILPADRNKYRMGNVVLDKTYPNSISYIPWNNFTLDHSDVSIDTNKDMTWIYLEYGEGSGYGGYSVAAPAKSIEDIDNICNKVKWYKTISAK